MSDGGVPRRTLLVLGAGALAVPVLSSLGCAGAGGGEVPTGSIGAGNVSALSSGQLKVVSPYSLVVGRDASGLYAMNLLCTHEGCDMSSDIGTSSIVCPCHESVFDFNGGVLQGPARSTLTHYKVAVDSSGAITVNADQTVSASTRVAV
jgi:Rieske Fe-S protein